MFSWLGNVVSRHWPWVIAFWLVLVVAVRLTAPRWDDVTYDGDLEFLPAEMISLQGDRLARAAFPQTRAKSQIVLVVRRADRPLEELDLAVADGLASRFHNRLGAVEFERARELLGADPEGDPAVLTKTGPEPHADQRQEHLQKALAAFDEAIRLDESWAAPVHNRALVEEQLGLATEASRDRDLAKELAPQSDPSTDTLSPPDAADLPLIDVWTPHHEVFGSKLISQDGQAALIVLQLTNEFIATDNMRVLAAVEQEVETLKRQWGSNIPSGLELGISGSAAVGGDMLRAAVESIRHTELLTVVLVIGILLLVYRSPFVALVPLLTIAVGLSLSIGILAALTQLHHVPGFQWWDFKVFKTTRIFIVVILFGAGTDFCLFLIARLREELFLAATVSESIGQALNKVGGTISASAFTTILGLGTMFFADFGKFRNSGPAIGLSLAITMAACLTFAPALLCAFGRLVFWPAPLRSGTRTLVTSEGWWAKLADRVVRRPYSVLILSLLALSPLAVWGWSTPGRVTFDLVSELPSTAPSMRGNQILQQHFPVGEGGPVIILARRAKAGFDDPDKDIAANAMSEIFELTRSLRAIPGVDSVRSIAEPLGDPPESIQLTTKAGLRKLFLRQHPLTKSLFFAQVPPYRGEVTRIEVVLEDNPFSIAAMETLDRIDAFVNEQARAGESFWHGAQFYFTGTTAGIRDLRAVTQVDFKRITLLVTLAVFVVILVLLRRPVVCLYLIFSVLFSYLVTIGATELICRWQYGETFVGLDWKVPVFLFVILVAVGEDYNIYLVARVYEEQRNLGPFGGLREAMIRTGGIVTSCGIIMAGSFVSMIAGSLRGIAELGFALTLGILLDTLVVRSILVPAFLAIVFRFRPEVRKKI